MRKLLTVLAIVTALLAISATAALADGKVMLPPPGEIYAAGHLAR